MIDIDFFESLTKEPNKYDFFINEKQDTFSCIKEDGFIFLNNTILFSDLENASWNNEKQSILLDNETTIQVVKKDIVYF